MEQRIYDEYITILRHELVPALGCTEPIAIAFTAARARAELGCFPEHIDVYCSGNIIKNVKSVIVPNSNGERGIEIAAALGCVGGDAKLLYEVLTPVTQADIDRSKALIMEGFCKTHYVEGKDNLFLRIKATAGAHNVSVTVEHEHTNVTHIERDGKVVFDAGKQAGADDDKKINKDLLNVKQILQFTNELKPDDVRTLLQRQIDMNTAISAEGLRGDYGASVGKTLMGINGVSVEGRAAARAAAGSDARMNGCGMPVVINSGSGNQGMTVTLPICEYAKTWGKDTKTLMRALALANLISIHIKHHIGNLSAFCGAVSAGCAAACGVAYMDGCTYEQICMTITNTLCDVAGIVCDGAKSSCAAKIASAVNAGLMSYRMAKEGKSFGVGEGLAGDSIEATIDNIGRMGRDGMRSTDVEILNIMVGK